MAKADQATVSLNGRTFSMKSVKDTKVIVQIEAMAEKAGLEFMRCGPLVAVGKGLKALNSDGVVSELKKTLGLNPYLIQVASKPQADVIVTPTLNPKGTTYQWAGFRTTYYPDTNAAAWYKYSETKVIRSWVNASASLSRYVIPPERVTTIEHFEAYKNQVRSNPEKMIYSKQKRSWNASTGNSMTNFRCTIGWELKSSTKPVPSTGRTPCTMTSFNG
jgi:hypothetical protein